MSRTRRISGWITIIVVSLVGVLLLSPFAYAAGESFVYTDDNSGLTFTVPDGWEEVPFYKEKELLKVKFQSTEDSITTIMFGSMDLWAEADDDAKQGWTREDLNNSAFSVEDVKELYDAEGMEATVTKTTVGNADYFQCVGIKTISEGGVEGTATITELVRFYNGFQYSFDFSGDEKSPYYDDFISMVESAKYPGEKTTEEITDEVEGLLNGTAEMDEEPEISDERDPYGINWPELLTALLITLFVYSAPIVIYRYLIKKQPVVKEKARTITVLYAVLGMVVAGGVLYWQSGKEELAGGMAGAVLLWSWINYLILTKGKNRNKDPFDDFMSRYQEQAKEMIKQNESVADKNIEDPMYGIIPTMPIYTNMVEGSKEYLSFLSKSFDIPLHWERFGSIDAEGIIGSIDRYKGYLMNDVEFITLYINMYCSHNSTTIPKALLYMMQKGEPEDNRVVELMFENASAANMNLDAPDYGLTPTKPIYVHMIEGSKEYLSSLRSESNEKLRWKFVETKTVDGVKGEVSIYDSFLPSGDHYKRVYVNKYCAYNSLAIPKGFRK